MMSLGRCLKVCPKCERLLLTGYPKNIPLRVFRAPVLQNLKIVLSQRGAETVLAFIMEPIGGLASEAVVSDDFYMIEVRRICSKYGVLLIHDEVMSGAGRTGKFLPAITIKMRDPT